MQVKSRSKILFFALPDLLLMYAALWLTIIIRYGHSLPKAEAELHYEIFSVAFLAWLLILLVNNSFEWLSLRRYSLIFFDLLRSMIANFLAAAVYFYYQPDVILKPRRFLLIDTAITFVLLLAWHLLLKLFYSSSLGERIYIFSPTGRQPEIEREIAANSFLGFKFSGYIDAEDLPSLEKNGRFSIVMHDYGDAPPETIGKLFALRLDGVKFYESHQFYEMIGRKVYMVSFNQAWFLQNIDYSQKRFYAIAKRAVDLVFGAVLMLAFIISFPFVYLFEKISEPRQPIIFRQQRVGLGGKVFTLYKYRSMSGGTASNTWTTKNDPRITRLGKFLRKTRIDELPQAINLLKGDMSLVGPRPEQVHIVEQLKEQIPFYNERHFVKPGLTGWGQIYVYAASVDEMRLRLQYDLYYIKYRSLAVDLEIIAKTVYNFMAVAR